MKCPRISDPTKWVDVEHRDHGLVTVKQLVDGTMCDTDCWVSDFIFAGEGEDAITVMVPGSMLQLLDPKQVQETRYNEAVAQIAKYDINLAGFVSDWL